MQAHKVADLDRRLGQIDSTIEEAAKRGRTKTALSAIEGQRKDRGARNRETGTLAALNAERASVASRGRQIETEAAPIRYVAEFLGLDTDSERAIRWLIALMVLCRDLLSHCFDRGGFGPALIPAFCTVLWWCNGAELARHRRLRRSRETVVEAWPKLWPANGMRCRTCHKRLRRPLTEIGQDLPPLCDERAPLLRYDHPRVRCSPQLIAPIRFADPSEAAIR